VSHPGYWLRDAIRPARCTSVSRYARTSCTRFLRSSRDTGGTRFQSCPSAMPAGQCAHSPSCHVIGLPGCASADDAC
jgi:hypothetical protein